MCSGRTIGIARLLQAAKLRCKEVQLAPNGLECCCGLADSPPTQITLLSYNLGVAGRGVVGLYESAWLLGSLVKEGALLVLFSNTAQRLNCRSIRPLKRTRSHPFHCHPDLSAYGSVAQPLG